MKKIVEVKLGKKVLKLKSGFRFQVELNKALKAEGLNVEDMKTDEDFMEFLPCYLYALLKYTDKKITVDKCWDLLEQAEEQGVFKDVMSAVFEAMAPAEGEEETEETPSISEE